MNTAKALNRSSMLLVPVIVLSVAVIWWVGEVRAEARVAPVCTTPAAPSVQDRKRGMDLDTQIFLHRNARIVTAVFAPLSA